MKIFSKKRFLILIFIFLSLFLAFLVLNFEARRYIFQRITPAYSLFQILSTRELLRERNFQELVESLDDYIDKSELLLQGKSKMFSEVVDVVERVVVRIAEEEDLKKFESIFRRLLTNDPDNYKVRIWLAKSLILEDPNEALIHIKKAISLSESDESAYRLIAKLLSRNSSELKELVCVDYKKAFTGEVQHRSHKNIFGGLGLNSFLLGIGKKPTNFYPHNGIMLDKRSNYEFIPLEPVTIDSINLYMSVLPGVKFKLHEVKLFEDNNSFNLRPKDFILSLNNGFIIGDDDEGLSLQVGSKDDDEIINLRFSRNYENIKKILIVGTFSRLPIVNNAACK